MTDNERDWLRPKYIDRLKNFYHIEIAAIDYHPLPYSTPPKYMTENMPGKLLADIPPVANPATGFGQAVFDVQDAFYIPYGNFAGYRRGGPWIKIIALD
jgi:hypothetical protein